MKRAGDNRWFIVLVTLVFACALPAALRAQQSPPPGKAGHLFKGKVENVDREAGLLTVNGEDVPGWMTSMTMPYKVDNESALEAIKAGDQITATVYDAEFSTLFNVRVTSAARK